MFQITQGLKDGIVQLEEIPTPRINKNSVLIKTSKSLVSLGTEKMLLDFGKGNLIQKAKQQPDKVKMVMDKVKSDGLISTFNAVKNKLDKPIPLGYSNVGVVIEVGSEVTEFKVGDRVVSNGPHAEIVRVPKNLCAKIPDSVSDEQAVFTVVSSIGLQGIRLANPTLGEQFVVIGLGLIGLITCQLLKANGCNVIGLDIDEKKVDLAKEIGVEAIVSSDNIATENYILSKTNEIGVDGVIITASTNSNAPIELAPKICRKRGRVVLVGVVGLTLNRTDFFNKEIQFSVSCSYGPGRYDTNYEEKGIDYPIGYVRWTEKRNFEAVLELINRKSLVLEKLITNRVEFLKSPELYSDLSEANKMELGILINYSQEVEDKVTVAHFQGRQVSSIGNIGVIGAGNFTSSVILPSLTKTKFNFKGISSTTGLSSNHLARKFKFQYNTTSHLELLSDNDIDTVFITTRHNTHCDLLIEALKYNKNVFLEKPLCINWEQFHRIEDYLNNNQNVPVLTVGFNRRFSKLINDLKKRIDHHKNKSIVMTINSGSVPNGHWTQDRSVGGGRLLGEGCHFIDLARHLIGTKILNSTIVCMDSTFKDTFSISLKFECGSIATIHYFSNGNKAIPKERIEVYVNNDIHVLDNFLKLDSYLSSRKKIKNKLMNQDKGYTQEFVTLYESIGSGIPPIPIDQLLEVQRICLELNDQLYQ